MANLVLTGFMGTGKSTVGRILARRLAREFVDTDLLIESRHGPIAAIFDNGGEAAFRAIERQVAAELARADNLVISTGGGMMVDPTSAELLAASGSVVCLGAPVDEILSRVRAQAVHRPLLDMGEPAARIRELLEQRRPVYESYPTIDTGGLDPDEVADRVLALAPEL